MVVEDIAAEAVPLWKVVSALLPARYHSHIFHAKGGVVFAAKRLA